VDEHGKGHESQIVFGARRLCRQVYGRLYFQAPEFLRKFDARSCRAAETHYLRVLVRQLRLRLGDDPTSPRFIQTAQGVGYRLR